MMSAEPGIKRWPQKETQPMAQLNDITLRGMYACDQAELSAEHRFGRRLLPAFEDPAHFQRS
jgi:hypothetical protein